MALMVLKVKIGLTASGSAAYPDFGSLECVKKAGCDWSHYVDREGHGWAYDKCGHKDHADHSPMGMQWGLLIVPEEFALQAEQAFPETCDALTEAETEAFWEEHCHAHLPDATRDADTLTALKAEIQLLKILIDEEDDPVIQQDLIGRLSDVLEHAKNALNPHHEAPGIKHNPRKKWCDYKAHTAMEFKCSGKQR